MGSNDLVLEEGAALTHEQKEKVRRLVYKMVPLKDSLEMLQILGIEPPEHDRPVCSVCGSLKSRQNEKSWRCNKCRQGRKDVKK